MSRSKLSDYILGRFAIFTVPFQHTRITHSCNKKNNMASDFWPLTVAENGAQIYGFHGHNVRSF